MVNEIQVKSILNKHKKRDNWFLDDYSVNPYEGCVIPNLCRNIEVYTEYSLHHQKNIKWSLKKNQKGCLRDMELKVESFSDGFGAECFVVLSPFELYNTGYTVRFTRPNLLTQTSYNPNTLYEKLLESRKYGI